MSKTFIATLAAALTLAIAIKAATRHETEATSTVEVARSQPVG